jgi:threonine dehydrogenase-like Zn-dependent dehydrogenase
MREDGEHNHDDQQGRVAMRAAAFPIDTVIFRNVGLRGGVAPVRRYIPQLLDDVLQGRINPGRVFDFETNLDGIAEAYAAMDERRAIKSLIRMGAKEGRQ